MQSTYDKKKNEDMADEGRTAMAAAAGAGEVGMAAGSAMGAVGGGVTGWGIGATQGVVLGLVLGMFLGAAFSRTNS